MLNRHHHFDKSGRIVRNKFECHKVGCDGICKPTKFEYKFLSDGSQGKILQACEYKCIKCKKLHTLGDL